ncbi:MAG: hypothetical protein IKS00_04170, partial [Bacteroidales bacterium]|nr:hypothetical protein [Bacteroidales bacterium]
LQVKPVPAIVMAQAFNGLILPFVCVFLFTVINNAKVMGKEHLNGLFSNIMMAAVTWVTLILGIKNLCDSVKTAAGVEIFNPDSLFMWASIIALVITLLITYVVINKRKRSILEVEHMEKPEAE